MSYTKPIKLCQDVAVGIDTVNDLTASQGDTRNLLAVEHLTPPEAQVVASGFGNQIGGGFGSIDNPTFDVDHGGEHNTPKVARGTMTVLYDTVVALGQLPVRVGVKSGVCVGFQRISAGQYFIPITGLTDFYAEVTAIADDNTVTRHVEQVSVYNTVQPGIFVTTWKEATLTGPNLGFTLSEFGFHVTVYGRRGELFDPGVYGSPMMVQGRSLRLNVPRRPRSGIFFVKV